ncbi:MAG: transglutaminase-like domain-containing protein [Firmicutes bacterium]|nr:transglutaminase-like domain-containing protein [Bacillota bacterium]
MDGTVNEKKSKTKKSQAGIGAVTRMCCLPENQEKTTLSMTLGFVCRVLVITAAVTGLSLFFTDSMVIVSEIVPFSTLLLSSLIFSSVISAIFINGYFAVGGTIALVGGVFAWLAMKSVNVIDYVWAAVRIFVNAVIDRISFAGLAGIQAYSLSSDYGGYIESELMGTAVALFTLLLAILFVPAMIRRVHIVYILVLGAVFTVPLFAYNVMRDNWGTAILSAALAAVIVLYMSDRLYTKPAKRKLIITDIKDTSFTAAAEAKDREASVKAFESLTSGNSGSEKKKKSELHAEKAEAKAAMRAMKRAKRHGKDTNIEAALTLETPSERKKRKKSEATEKKAAKKAQRAEIKERNKKQRLRLSAKERLLNAALGGPAALAVFVVLMLAILIPTSVVETYQDGIPYISEFMETSRTYVTAFLMGDELDLNDVGNIDKDGSAGAHSIAVDYPKYSDILIATVEVPYDTPVYLRTWVATLYDDDMWYSATLSDVTEYRAIFGSDFTPEVITEAFYDAVYPNYNSMSDYAGYKANVKYGFITERVNVTRELGNGVLLYLPSTALPSYGLLQYQSTSSSRLYYSKYYEGIWTSKYFFEDTQYSTVSLVTTMLYTGLDDMMADELYYYSYTMELITSGEADEHIGEEDYVTAYEAALEADGITYIGDSLLRRYLLEMTSAERKALTESYELERSYSEYVDEIYTETDEDDNAEIYELTVSILEDGGVSEEVLSALEAGGTAYGMDEYYYEIVMALVDYLSENIEYSITEPETDETVSTAEETEDETAVETEETQEDAEEDLIGAEPLFGEDDEEEETLSAILDFLTVSKTGYCVQYASAVTMMLRSIGIPARYCEGFLASDFSTSKDNEAIVRYSCGVLDSDAHAWVEVYYDYMGWMQYEVTQPYLEGMYGADGSSSGTNDTDDNKTEANINYITPDEGDDVIDIDNIDVGTEEGISPLFIAAAILAASAAVLLIILTVHVILSLHKSRAKVRMREKMIERASDLDIPLTDCEASEYADEMSHAVFELYALLGLEPETGELSEEYAARVTERLGSVSKRTPTEILGYIAKGQFGYGMSRREVAFLAEYYGDLTDSVYRGLGVKNRFVFRYVRRAV